MSAEIEVYKHRMMVVENLAQAYTVESQKDIDSGADILTKIKEVEAQLKEAKEGITKPLMEGLAAARDLFKPLETGLSNAKKEIKDKQLVFVLAEQARIEEAKAKVDARVERGTMKPTTAAAKHEAIGTGAKANTRTITKVRVVDAALVPREWCVPNLPAITEAVLKQGAVIPGVESYQETIIVTK